MIIISDRSNKNQLFLRVEQDINFRKLPLNFFSSYFFLYINYLLFQKKKKKIKLNETNKIKKLC